MQAWRKTSSNGENDNEFGLGCIQFEVVHSTTGVFQGVVNVFLELDGESGIGV